MWRSFKRFGAKRHKQKPLPALQLSIGTVPLFPTWPFWINPARNQVELGKIAPLIHEQFIKGEAHSVAEPAAKRRGLVGHVAMWRSFKRFGAKRHKQNPLPALQLYLETIPLFSSYTFWFNPALFQLYISKITPGIHE